MTTDEMPRELRADYFNGLSEQYQGWATTVQVFGQDEREEKPNDLLAYCRRCSSRKSDLD